MNIYEKMAAASQEIGLVTKDLKIQVAKGRHYSAVSEGAVLQAVKAVFAKYRIYGYPAMRTVIKSETIKCDDGRLLFHIVVETIYRFVNLDDPKDILEVISYGDGQDFGDKSTGKCLTYSDKYALLRALSIETGDDPDQDASIPISAKNPPVSDGKKATPFQIRSLKQSSLYQKIVQKNGEGYLENEMSSGEAARCLNYLKSKKLKDDREQYEKDYGIDSRGIPVSDDEMRIAQDHGWIYDEDLQDHIKEDTKK